MTLDGNYHKGTYALPVFKNQCDAVAGAQYVAIGDGAAPVSCQQ
jgi:hypothetical protein